MSVTPGLPIAFCNQAMVDLTGYPREQIEGRNCRFLQGKRTEAAAVRAMVSGIRSAKVTTVRVTNYRKDGSQFTNMLTLVPVLDSEGVYRFNLGVLADDARSGAEGAALEKLRAALPRRFEAAKQPAAKGEASRVDPAAQVRQWKDSLTKFTRLLWSMDWEGSLRQLMRQRRC